MGVEEQLESSAESPILFDGLPHLVEEGMEDVEERLLPEVVPPGVSRVTAQLLFPLVQSVTSPPAQSQFLQVRSYSGQTHGMNRV